MLRDVMRIVVIDSNSGRLDIPNESDPHPATVQVSASLLVRILRKDPVGESAKSELLQNALTSQQLGSQKGVSKRNKAEAGSGISHWGSEAWIYCNGM